MMKVAIVEDDDLLRGSLEILLAGQPEIEVNGAYGSAEEALGGVQEKPPDVALVDLGLPGMTGLELISKLKDLAPEVDILVHTVFESRPTVFAAIKAGAAGYMLKRATPRELIEALFSLYEGGAPMTPKIARAVINEFRENPAPEDYLLSKREKMILLGLEEGLTYKEIGSRYSISPHTVHSHIKKIYEKLHAKGRQEALLQARRKGLI